MDQELNKCAGEMEDCGMAYLNNIASKKTFLNSNEFEEPLQKPVPRNRDSDLESSTDDINKYVDEMLLSFSDSLVGIKGLSSIAVGNEALTREEKTFMDYLNFFQYSPQPDHFQDETVIPIQTPLGKILNSIDVAISQNIHNEQVIKIYPDQSTTGISPSQVNIDLAIIPCSLQLQRSNGTTLGEDTNCELGTLNIHIGSVSDPQTGSSKHCNVINSGNDNQLICEDTNVEKTSIFGQLLENQQGSSYSLSNAENNQANNNQESQTLDHCILGLRSEFVPLLNQPKPSLVEQLVENQRGGDCTLLPQIKSNQEPTGLKKRLLDHSILGLQSESEPLSAQIEDKQVNTTEDNTHEVNVIAIDNNPVRVVQDESIKQDNPIQGLDGQISTEHQMLDVNVIEQYPSPSKNAKSTLVLENNSSYILPGESMSTEQNTSKTAIISQYIQDITQDTNVETHNLWSTSVQSYPINDDVLLEDVYLNCDDEDNAVCLLSSPEPDCIRDEPVQDDTLQCNKSNERAPLSHTFNTVIAKQLPKNSSNTQDESDVINIHLSPKSESYFRKLIHENNNLDQAKEACERGSGSPKPGCSKSNLEGELLTSSPKSESDSYFENTIIQHQAECSISTHYYRQEIPSLSHPGCSKNISDEAIMTHDHANISVVSNIQNTPSNKSISFKRGIKHTSTPIKKWKGTLKHLSVIEEIDSLKGHDNAKQDLEDKTINEENCPEYNHRDTNNIMVKLEDTTKQNPSENQIFLQENVFKKDESNDKINEGEEGSDQNNTTIIVNADETVVYKDIEDRTIDEVALADGNAEKEMEAMIHLEHEPDRERILEKAKNLQVFISKDEAENKDNFDPEWEAMKKLETDDEL